MNHWRIVFLITVLAVTSGYRFRCYFGCTDQTSIQNDYVEQRDTCREYAQLKVQMAMREDGAADDRARKSYLVSLFSQCMGNNGWVVPDGKGEGGKKADLPPPPPNLAAQAIPIAPPVSAAAIATTRQEEKAAMTRASECAFARNSADVSSIAATRAEACDLECEHALKASPGGPRPPSCPSDIPARLAKGHEK